MASRYRSNLVVKKFKGFLPLSFTAPLVPFSGA